VLREHRAACRREEFRSYLAVPMRIGGHPIGALFILSKPRRAFAAGNERLAVRGNAGVPN
jgi:GAF domain-containing protein